MGWWHVSLRSAYGHRVLVPTIGWYTAGPRLHPRSQSQSDSEAPCHGGQRKKAVKINLPFLEAT